MEGKEWEKGYRRVLIKTKVRGGPCQSVGGLIQALAIANDVHPMAHGPADSVVAKANENLNQNFTSYSVQ